MPVQDVVPLADLPPDTPSVVRRIPDDDPDLLRYVASLGLVPDAVVTVKRRGPFNGPVFLEVSPPVQGDAAREQVIGSEIAARISVSRPG
jgi:Fe2+ transport system protein FeoA